MNIENFLFNITTTIPSKMVGQPHINWDLVVAVHEIKMTQSTRRPPRPYHILHNKDPPDKPYITELVKKTGNTYASNKTDESHNPR